MALLIYRAIALLFNFQRKKRTYGTLTCVLQPQVKRQKTISDPGVVVVFAAVFVEELLQKGGRGGSARVTKLIRTRACSIPYGSRLLFFLELSN